MRADPRSCSDAPRSWPPRSPGRSAAGRWPSRWPPPGRRPPGGWPIGAGVALTAATAIASSLPIIPRDQLRDSIVVAANPTVADQIGWREYVWQIAAVHADLSAADQRRAVLFTGNYGEAGALDRYGSSFGLPAVYSGHNELHRLGPPPEGRTVVVAVLQAAPRELGRCSAAARLTNSVGVANEEVGASVYVCRLDQPWSRVWPRLQHYD